jgi:hypothetical protein
MDTLVDNSLSAEELLKLILAEREEGEAVKEKLAKAIANSKKEQLLLDSTDPGVTKDKKNNMLSADKRTHKMIFTSNVHTSPERVKEALTVSDKQSGSLRVTVAGQQNSAEGLAVQWMFMASQNKACEVRLRLKVSEAEPNGGLITIGVSSIDDEEEIEFPPLESVWKAAKIYRLRCDRGKICLQRIDLGQTSFTFSAELSLTELFEEVESSKAEKAKSRRQSSSSLSKSAAGTGLLVTRSLHAKDSARADKMFCKIGSIIYERFKQEDVIDARTEENFIRVRVCEWRRSDELVRGV